MEGSCLKAINMRDELKPFFGKRLTFQGVVTRFGSKSRRSDGKRGTVLMTHIHRVGEMDKSEEQIAVEHQWFTLGKWSHKLNLKVGAVVTFTARISAYTKHDQKGRPTKTDFELSRLKYLSHKNRTTRRQFQTLTEKE